MVGAYFCAKLCATAIWFGDDDSQAQGPSSALYEIRTEKEVRKFNLLQFLSIPSAKTISQIRAEAEKYVEAVGTMFAGLRPGSRK